MELFKIFLLLLIGIFGVSRAQLGRECTAAEALNCRNNEPCLARPLPDNAPANEPNYVCDCTSRRRIGFGCDQVPLGNRDFITCYGINCSSGFFESENYPNIYPDRWSATYLLYIPGARRIDFRFADEAFGIESFKDELWVGTGLNYTFTTIENANSSDFVDGDFELRFFDNRTLMGRATPPQFSLNTDTVMLYFATDRNIRWDGFRLEWNALVDADGPIIISCPMDITLTVEVGVAISAVAMWIPPTANDISNPVTSTSSHQPGDTFFIGQTEVTYTFRDRFENEAICSFFVNVIELDSEPPVIDICPDDILRTIELGDPDPAIFWRVPMATDLGGQVNVVESHSPGSTFSPGITMVTYVFTDLANNNAICNFLVTINTEDTTPPDILNCPDPIVEMIELGTGSIVITWTEPTSSDISGTDFLVSRSHPPGSEFMIGNTFVEYVFRDAIGNEAICRFLVQIRTVDTTPPAIINCPSRITTTVELGLPGIVVDWTAPTSFDVSEAVTLDASHSPGQFFIVGTTPVTYLFTDETGNSALCNFCVEIISIDTVPPVVSNCPQNQNIVVELGITSSTAFWVRPTATDVSGSVEITTETHQPGDSFFLGMTTVMYAFSDPSGNTNMMCMFTITVSTEDTVAPTIENCPAMIVETIELGVADAVIVWEEPSASDISGVVMQIQRTHQPGDRFPVGITSVTYQFSDNSNNIAMCTFLVLIQTEDTTPPTISGCPNNIVEIVELGVMTTVVTWIAPSATDLSLPVILISNSHSPNTPFQVGTTTVTYIFQDNAMNQNTCTFDVIVATEDTIPPVVQCPMEISMTVELGTPGVIVTYNPETVFDVSGTAVFLSRSHASGDFYLVGTTMVRIAYIDDSGNVGDCTFNIIVETVDTQPPVISDCPMDQTVTIELGTLLGIATWVPPTASDVSGVADLVVESHTPGDMFPITSTTVTYLFQDSSGNMAVCSFIITVQTIDTTPPEIMNCPTVDPVVVELGMQVGIAVWAEPMATDNSGIVSLVDRTHGPGESFPVGKTTVVYTFIDPAGLTSVCQFMICVETEDTTPPEISNCPVVVQDVIELGLPGTVATWTEPTATDESGIATVATRSHAPNSFFMVGMTEVTYTFIDGNGLTSVCTFVVIITTVDTTPPTIIGCPNDLSPVLELGSPGNITTWVIPTATDVSDTAVLVSQSHVPGDFFPSNVKTTITYIFGDMSGNTATCSFCIEFQFVDTVPPVISNCPADQTVVVELGSATGTATWVEPSATDVSGTATLLLRSNPPGSDFPIGSTTVTYIFGDDSDNTATCTFIITVVTEDTTPPDISGCPSGQTVTIELGLMEGIAVWTIPTATDLSGIAILETQTHTPGDGFNIGMTTVMYVFVDGSGNSATCSFVVTVVPVDTVMPVISNCPTVIDALVECGLPGRSVEWVEPTASDLSGVAMLVTRSHAPNSFFPVGPTTVIYTFRDASNNEAVCSFMVVVIEVDTTPPVISEVPDALQDIIELGEIGCFPIWTEPIATDKGSNAAILSQTHMPGDFFPADTETTVCYTFIDTAGNTAMVCFCVTCTPVDTTPPDIMNCPNDLTVSIELGMAGTSVIWPEPTASDVSGTAMLQSRSNLPNSFFTVGMTTVVYTFVDASRNIATCSFVVTVTPVDTTPPTISNCPDDIDVNVELGQLGTTVSWEEPMASDISGFTMVSSRSSVPNDFFGLGPTQVTYVFIDASNNAAQCTFTITVNTIDTTPPDIMNCPQNQFETVELGVTSAIIIWQRPTASDISGTAQLLSESHAPGTAFMVGATVVTYEFTDSSGNVNTCTFNVIVTTVDTTPPTIMGCPLGVAEVVELGTPGSLSSWVVPTASDLSPPVEVTVNRMPNTFFTVGVTAIIYTFRDSANNEATCTFDVVVTTVDTTPPTISDCPIEVPFVVELGTPGSQVSWPEPSASDLSGMVAVTSTRMPGDFFPVGDTNVIYTFTDDSGNAAECIFIVRVTTVDTTPPTIENCPADIVEMIELGAANPVIFWTDPSASDLSPTRILSQSNQPGMSFPIGDTTVTYIFTDTSSNTAICSFTITVVTIDTTPPVISNCPVNPTVTVELGTTEGSVPWTEPFATDLSGVATLDERSHIPGSLFPVGQTTVMYVFIDSSGNAAVCQFVVIVNTEDTTAPTILNCPNLMNIEIELGLPGTVATWDEPMANDISGTQMVAMRSHQPGDFFPVGMTTVMYTFTDASGNTAMCSFIINVIEVDTLPPAITACPGIDAPEITVTIELGTPSTAVDFSLPSATDISQDVMVFSNCASGDTYNVGETQCTFTFTDPSGNSALCTFTIEVLTEDTTPPTVTRCPTTDVTAVVELGIGSTTVTYLEPLAIDNSLSTMLLQSQSCVSGDSYNVGTTMCLYLFIDPSGNSMTCTFNIVVTTEDTTPPDISNCPMGASTTIELGLLEGAVFWTAPSASDLSGTANPSSTHQPGQNFPLGVTIVTYTFTDSSGNEATCSFPVTVTTVDTTPPNIVDCPFAIERTIELGIPGINTPWSEPSATDISGTVTLLSRSHAPNDLFFVGTTMVSYLFSDPTGNTAECVFCVTINTVDTTPPTISNCPPDITVIVELGLTSGTATWITPTATDESGVAQIISQSHSPGDSFPLMDTMVTYIFTDASGNTNNCIFTVTVETEDTTPPVCSNLPQEVTECVELGLPGTNVELPQPTCVDISNTGMVTTSSHASGAFFVVGETPVTYICSDESGNNAQCRLTVNVETKDTTPPEISGCPLDQTVTIELGMPSGPAFWAIPTASDLSGETILVTQTNTPGDSFMIGMTTVLYIFEDINGNSATCSFVVTVVTEDTTPPTIMNCPDRMEFTIELGLSGRIVSWTQPTASDISGVAMVSSRSHAPGDLFPVGVTTVTYTFTDNSGNMAVCTFMIIILTEDTTPPTCVSVPGDIVREVELGQFGAVLSWTPPTCDDISGTGRTTAPTHTPPSFFMVGMETVMYTCIDDSGNTNQCSFNVEVISVDTLPPAITGCPGEDRPPVVVTIELGTPTAEVDFNAPSASDLSGDVIVSSNCQPGDNYPVGETNCVFIFSDSSGNSAECPFIIQVLTEDTTPPQILNCPTPGSVAAVVELGITSAIVTYPEIVATDNSMAPMLLQSQTCRSGDSYPVGNTMCLYIFTDPTGNTSPCSFSVSVTTIDTTPPTVDNCPLEASAVVELGLTQGAVFYTEPTATDLSGDVTVTSTSTPGQLLPLGSTIITYTFTDSSGNQAFCIFEATVTTVDTTPPTITDCPDDIVVDIELGMAGTIVSWPEPSASDISGTANTISRSNMPNEFFLVGPTTVTYIFSDPSGNTAECRFCVTVDTVDTTPPVISNCPNDVTVFVELGLATTGIATWTRPTATDISGVAQITTESNRPGDSFPLGSTTVTYIFTDASGNSEVCTFVVTINTEDTTPPTVIGCPTQPVTVTVELGTASAIVTYPEPFATDNSQSTMLLQSQSCTSGSSYNVGETTCLYLFVDPSGNSSPCTFTVVVETVDTTPPTITNCPVEASTVVELGITQGVIIWNEPSGTDLSGSVMVTSNRQPGDTFNLGDTTIIYTFTDSSGNENSCIFVATVNTVDTTPPTITGCPSDMVRVIELGLPGAVLNWPEPSASDISGTANLIARSHAPSDLLPEGLTTITYTFSDASGNTETCSFTVTILTEDTTPPTISNCPLDQTVVVELGITSGIATWTPPTASDLSGVAQVVSQTHMPGGSFPLGATTVTYTYADASGNTDTCFFTVTVITVDTTPPMCVNLPEEVSECVELGIQGTNVDLPEPTCFDISNTGMVSARSHQSGSFFFVGDTIVTYTCSDESGNSADCTLTVRVVTKDTTPPVITGCPADQTITIELGLPTGVGFWIEPSATDISGMVSLITRTSAPGDSFMVGMTTVLYVFQDSSSNDATCSFVVTVVTEDTTPPTIMNCPSTISNVIELGISGLNVPWTEPTASDVSGVAMVSTRSHIPNSFFPVGVTTVSYTFTDNSNNQAMCTFMIIITTEDTTPPTCVDVPDDMQEVVELGQFGAVLSWTPPSCDDISGTGEISAATHTPPTFFMVGMTTTVVYTCTDDSGNSAMCSFDVQVIPVDTTPPAITGCPSIDAPNVNAVVELGTTSTMITYTEPTATDISESVTVTSNCMSGQTFPVGETTCTYTFIDNSGNSMQCSFPVMVTTVDTTPPDITGCPSGVEVEIELGQPEAVAFWVEPSASDICGEVSLTSRSAAPGDAFPVGLTQVTYIFTDCSNNNNVCTFPVTVTTIDTTPPTITDCPANIQEVFELGNIITGIFWAEPSASDISGVAQLTDRTHTPGNVFPEGVTLVSYMFTDSSNNVATCTFTVTVIIEDTTRPVIICPADVEVIVQLFAGSGTAMFSDPTATDASNAVSVSCDAVSGGTYPTGTTLVTCTAVDSSANSAQCTFNITITEVDSIDPMVTCPVGPTVTVIDGQEGVCVDFDNPTASDNSGTANIISVSPESGAYFMVGVTTVTVVVSDPSGNTASCSFDVTVLEANPCDPDPCQNGAFCVIDSLTAFTCVCPDCFQGTLCEVEINACDGNLCQNGAACAAVEGSCTLYTCECNPCFSGEFCENFQDACSNNDCQNGGTCVQDQSCVSYTCRCPACFEGAFCQTAINPCEFNTCANGAQCIPDTTEDCAGFSCICTGCFTGFQCNIEIDPCSPSPCQNGAQCFRDASNCYQYTCQCQGCFHGPNCEAVIPNPCLPINPCQNGGQCTRLTTTCNAYRCSCPNGFGGFNCQDSLIINRDPCNSFPCENGGTCLETSVGGYVCMCRNGYAGINCDQTTSSLPVVLFSCNSSPCLNGGTCRNSYNSASDNVNYEPQYTCICTSVFTGPNCQIPSVVNPQLNACSGGRCQNGGECFNTYDSFTQAVLYSCSCPVGFIGQDCEIPADNPCDSSPCQNSALCTPFNTYFMCSCIDGFTGTFCQVPPDSPRPFVLNCPSDEITVTTQGITAPASWTEPMAVVTGQQVAASYRSHMPGQNFPVGTTPVTYVFSTLDGQFVECLFFVTVKSSTVTDRCTPQPCLNGGRCLQTGVQLCDCSGTGFMGPRCQTPIIGNVCQPNPCDNGATCIADPPGFSCLCPPGFGGASCSIEITDLSSLPSGLVLSQNYPRPYPSGYREERIIQSSNQAATLDITLFILNLGPGDFLTWGNGTVIGENVQQTVDDTPRQLPTSVGGFGNPLWFTFTSDNDQAGNGYVFQITEVVSPSRGRRDIGLDQFFQHGGEECPCQNGGSCINVEGLGNYCLCPEEFEGIVCEVPHEAASSRDLPYQQLPIIAMVVVLAVIACILAILTCMVARQFSSLPFKNDRQKLITG